MHAFVVDAREFGIENAKRLTCKTRPHNGSSLELMEAPCDHGVIGMVFLSFGVNGGEVFACTCALPKRVQSH